MTKHSQRNLNTILEFKFKRKIIRVNEIIKKMLMSLETRSQTDNFHTAFDLLSFLSFS